jgi:hypothetical protein
MTPSGKFFEGAEGGAESEVQGGKRGIWDDEPSARPKRRSTGRAIDGIGLSLSNIPDSAIGCEVEDAQADLAATACGLRAGDLVVSVNGEAIMSSAHATRLLTQACADWTGTSSKKADEPIELVVTRPSGGLACSGWSDPSGLPCAVEPVGIE